MTLYQAITNVLTSANPMNLLMAVNAKNAVKKLAHFASNAPIAHTAPNAKTIIWIPQLQVA